jgi:hypothetical protein
MKLFKSKNFIEEYSATVVKIEDIVPIEGSDFLGTTVVAGYDIVVRKDQVKKGDIMIYCPIETKINSDFLKMNNLYEKAELNNNPNITGYFNSSGRVRIIRLKKKPSMGVLFDPNDLKAWTSIDVSNISTYIGTSFDMIDGNLFISVYMPPTKEEKIEHKNWRNKKLKKFDRIIPGTFFFHYDTAPLNRNIDKINPNDVITITEKMDGTSFILSNILTKRKLKLYEKLGNFLHFTNYPTKEYCLIYSSRNVIKNRYINKNCGEGFYKTDIWKDIAEKFGKYIGENITVYGECVGYEPETSKLIQKKGNKLYTYGCKIGQYKIMPYRITEYISSDKIIEYDVEEVINWTNDLIKFLKEGSDIEGNLSDCIMPMKLLYHGKAKDLYPDLDIANHWNENVLEKLKVDKDFLMEQDEPLCPKGVPAEGIVIRKDADKIKEAFKLKCLRYLNAEAKDVDAGIIDSESKQAY